jgi:3D (Asp-Asp-Asp) domain-containing protein
VFLSEVNRIARSLSLALTFVAIGLAMSAGPVGVNTAVASPQLSALDEDEADAPELSEGRSFTARLTAYAHGSRTASGTPVRWGVVAVDPRVVPLGSRIRIDGFDNVFIAEDTGGGVRGNHVDIYFPDVSSAIRFGVQYRTVTVLS